MTARVVALIGAPNTGKSSLFNILTGSRQKVGNYPGVTVEKKVGELKLSSGQNLTVIDLPGTYSLNPQSLDEKIVSDILFRRIHVSEYPDVILAIADATNLERTLGIVVALKQFGVPTIVALNMYDLAVKRGLKLDLLALEKELGAVVVPSIAVKKQGITNLVRALETACTKLEHQQIQKPNKAPVAEQPLSLDSLMKQQIEIDRILAKVIREPTQADRLTYQLDRIFLHRIFGGMILFLILFTMFQAVFSWAQAPMEMIEKGVEFAGGLVKEYIPSGLIQSLLADGLIAGVGSVLVFLPQILILFFFILILEGSGYMARAALIMDKIMSFVGLQGRSFVPLLSSFACAIPGIMAARTIRNPRDRLLTILISPLMTCSARLPVYVLLIGAFVPNLVVFGPIRLQGLVMFGLFLVAILSAMLVALVFRKVALKGTRSPFLLDMPTYKLPQPKYLAMNLWQRARAFLKKAGSLILMISFGMWILANFPAPPENADRPAIHYSIAGRIGHAIEPIIRPLGFDWRIATGLIPGFAAREVMVSALGTVFAVEDAEESGNSLLQEQIKAAWSVPTGLSLLAWYVFAPQCLSTLAVARRETNSVGWTFVMFSYMLTLAYLAAFVTYRLALFFV